MDWVGERDSSEAHYRTTLLPSSKPEDGVMHKHIFFRRLDDEFNKVVRSYRKKVQEVVKEADELTRQMNALIALRFMVDKPHIQPHGDTVDVPEQSQDPSSHHPGSEKPSKEVNIIQTFVDILASVQKRQR